MMNRRTKMNRASFSLLPALAIVLAVYVLVLLPFLIIRGNSRNSPDFYGAVTRRINEEIVYVPEVPIEYRYSNAILEALEYDVVSGSKDGKTAEVYFRYVDVLALADSFGERELTLDEYYGSCIDAILGGDAPMAERTIRLNFEEVTTQTGYELQVVDSFEFLDVISGGTVGRFTAMLEEITE